MTRIPAFVAFAILVAGPAALAAPAPPPVIHAAYTAAGGERDVRDVRLWVDGADVTSSATVTPLRVAYSPQEPLSAGQHAARVVVTDSLGRAWTKEWTFTVEAATPVLEDVWSDELLVELEHLPRTTTKERLGLTGFTQPGAEVVVRVDEDEAARAIASPSGRFRVTLPLGLGDNAIAVAAHRLDASAQGPEVLVRVERVAPPATADPGDDAEPPAWRPPGLRARPELVLAHRGSLDPRTGDLTPIELPKDDDEHARPGAGRGDHAGGARPPVGPGAPGGLSPDPLPGGEDDDDDGVPGDDEPVGDVVITKPEDGQVLVPGHVTVLGRAPAGWRVTVRVDGSARGSDDANPAGHFTVPRVELGEGRHELVAEAEHDGRLLTSDAVHVEVAGTRLMFSPAPLALTSPERGTTVARGSVQRVSGTAWEGAEVEVDVNGRVVARDVAGVGGHFDLDVPLEPGLNVLLVEAASADGARLARSRELAVTASGRVSAVVRQPPLDGERPRLPGAPGLPTRLPVSPRPLPRLTP